MIKNQYDTPIYVVVVAGGQGTRMGMALPKQFLPLQDKPILYHTLSAFATALPEAHIIVVLPEKDISKLQMVLQHFSKRIDLTVTVGGESRFESVKNGLKDIPTESIILVHDGVRPFVTAALIYRCVEAAIQYGAAIPTTQLVNSVRLLSEDGKHTSIDRNKLRNIQTPQAFKGSILLPAFKQLYQTEFTDEATVVENMGHNIKLIEGDSSNIKITTPEDLELAEMLLITINQSRT